MLKAIVGLLSISTLLVSCAAPPNAAPAQASAARSTAPASASSSVDTPVANDQDYETVFVPAPTGSLLGGGSVRVAKRNISGTDENALLSNIRRLNAAAGTTAERPYVVTAVSRATGVAERELQAQQDLLRLRFGELCAINAIARGNSNKVQEIATLKSKGRSWTDIAQSNGMNIATVVKVAQNANELTASSYTNAADRAQGGQQKLKDLGRPRPNVPKGG